MATENTNISYSLEGIKLINKEDQMSGSVSTLNYNYNALYLSAVEIQNLYNQELNPFIEYYNENSNILFDSLSLYSQSSAKWFDFLTIVQTNSSKWLQPMTIFYPTIIADPVTENDIQNINNWLRKYFPIKNSDGTLNYVENQKFIVNFYTYTYTSQVNVLDQVSSYCNCQTYSGNITLHCQTIITGGWIECHQGSYNCNTTLNCYPSLAVDCWYQSPYLHADQTPIKAADAISTKQLTVSKIQATLNMNYIDRRENSIQTVIFYVNDCDWKYFTSVNSL
jgi:hypothetical protein